MLLMGKLTISMAMFQFAFCMFTRPGIWSEEILQVTSDPSLAWLSVEVERILFTHKGISGPAASNACF